MSASRAASGPLKPSAHYTQLSMFQAWERYLAQLQLQNSLNCLPTLFAFPVTAAPGTHVGCFAEMF